MLDFTPAAARRPELFSGPVESTSTALAAVYGLEAEWTSRPGMELLADFFARIERPSYSRVADPVVLALLDAGDSMILPAVAGHTVWSSGVTSGVFVSQPNFVGTVEDLRATGSVGQLGVMIEPGLAGVVSLPDVTQAVLINLGDQSVSLAPRTRHPGEWSRSRHRRWDV